MATPLPSFESVIRPTGEEVDVLWVKGSGGDLGSIKQDGFATLYLSRLRALEGLYRASSTRTRWSIIFRTAHSA